MKTLRLMLIAISAGAAQLALAHAELTTSAPANCAMLESAPENVTLSFSEPVRLTALTVQKDGAAKQSLGPLPADTSSEFVVAVPEFGDGHYMVAWRALSEDTHVMTGELMFAVGSSAEHGQHMNCAANGGGDHAPQGAGEHRDDHAGAH